jgi:predicted outer membrane repeat protein
MADVIYVDIDAKGLNNGTSWPNAYQQLQIALWSASSGDEIWVAEGTYYPTGTTDRTVSFQLINKVPVYGGFDPTSGVVNFADRDWDTYQCILSGDIGVPGDTSDNSYHLFYHAAGLGLNDTAVLDGFTITLGRATGGVDPYTKGAAMYNDGSSPKVIHCTFEDNYAIGDSGGAVFNTNSSNTNFIECTFLDNHSARGGAVCNINSSPTFNNCDFGASLNENDAGSGGAIYNQNCSPLITNCTFSYNDAEDGGAIFNDNSSPTVDTCTFENNTVLGISITTRGGAMANINGSYPTISGSTFRGNLAPSAAFGKGGAIFCDMSSGPHISSTRFEDNNSFDKGGAIYCDGGPMLIDENCVFFSNSAPSGGAIYCQYSSLFSVTDCIFEENEASDKGGAVFCEGASPSFTRCDFLSNTADLGGGAFAFMSYSGGTISECDIIGNSCVAEFGGGIYCVLSSPFIINSTLSENTAKTGGAVACYLNCYTEIKNCKIINNTAEYDGGALFFWDSCFPSLTNCIIADNIITVGYPGYGEGGAAYIEICPDVSFFNCTISNNTALSTYGGIYSAASTVALTNSIVWGNSGTQLSTGLTITYSDVQGGYAGTGNIDVDPQFVNSAGGDYHLQNTSDCMEAGLNSAVPIGTTTDIDGDDRIIDGDGDSTATVDMGADEILRIILTAWVDDDYTSGGANDGHTWGVDAFASIQEGIEALGPTGTLYVAEGHYTENITITKDLTIFGDGAHQTIIDGNSSGTVVYAYGLTADARIDGFTITNGTGNTLVEGGFLLGGGLLLNDSDLTLSNCFITGNTAEYGGGMDNEAGSSPKIINCLFTNNTAEYGGAMDNYSLSSPEIYNCTFSNNTSISGVGGALYNENNCSPTIYNSILWADSGGEIYDLTGCTTTISNSDVQGAWPGSNNLDVNPAFLDAPADNYRLDPDSLCIDVGMNFAIFLAYNKDLDGNPRLAAKLCDVNNVVDMGCYEFNRERIGDFDDDCSIDAGDLTVLAGDWLTDEPLTDIAPTYRDGIVNLTDLAAFSEYWLLEFE